MSGEPSREILDQYQALKSAVGWLDVSGRTKIEVNGKDRAAFLHNFCTNDIRSLEDGQGCEAFITSVQGKVLGHGCIFCRSDGLLVETVPDQAEPLLAHFDRYLIREDASFTDRTCDWGEILVAGPDAGPLLGQLFSAPIPEQPCHHTATTLENSPVTVCRVGLAGPDSLLIICDADAVSLITDQLLGAGAKSCCRAALDCCRLEAGWPYYGVDITDENLVQEVGRDAHAVNFNKGCYLGQETVARIDALGHVNRQLVGLRSDSAPLPQPGTSILRDGQSVGRVTSSAYSPALEANLALGYVRRGHNEAGTQLVIDDGPAEVISLPVA